MSLPTPLRKLAAPPVFIVGVPRSGTTWLLDILSAHPQVGGVFESFLFSSQHGLGALSVQPSWNADFDSYQRRRTGRSTGVRQLISRDELRQDLRELTARWLARAIQPDNRRYLVAKENEVADLPIIADLFPESRFVHILRDGRDVTVSHRAAARSWAPGMDIGHKTVYSIAKRWKYRLSEIREVLGGLDNPAMEIPYEQLREHQLQEQERIFAFCDIPYDQEIGRGIVERSAFELHPVTGEQAFRRQGRSGAWRSSFGWIDAWLFDRGAGDLLVELGYESDRRWWLRYYASKLRQRSQPG